MFYGDVIVKAGGVNAFQGAVETAAITFEELVALKPDIVIDVRGLAPQIPIPYKESLQEKDNIGDEILYVERILRGINPANQ